MIAIDPGEDTGWAKGVSGQMVDCGLLHITRDRSLIVSGAPVVFGGLVYIEFPIHRGHKNEVDPNDLLQLGAKASRFREYYLERGNRVIDVFPHTWKGSVPKHIHQAHRILPKLRPAEKAILDRVTAGMTDGKKHNVVDAAGLFIWAAEKEGLRCY